MDRMTNRIVLVTGAGAGIGEQICRRVANEGGTVVAMDLDEGNAIAVAEAVRAAGGSSMAVQGDVSNAADCERVVRQVRNEYGRLHALFNVAGIVDGGTLVETSEESWARSMDINVKGMWQMCRLVVPMMVEQHGGNIVNISSVAGPFGVKNRGVYSVSKAAVIGLTKSLATDFLEQGLRVNAICPGTVESPSLHDRINQSPNPEQAMRDFIARQPMGRLGKPEEIAALAVYLAAEESNYMTGQAIVIDGGMTL